MEIYADEWIRVTNHKNREFKVSGSCSQCGFSGTYRVWYSLKRGEIRCIKCFDPRMIPTRIVRAEKPEYIIANNRVAAMIALDCVRMIQEGEQYGVELRRLESVLINLKSIVREICMAAEMHA